MRLNNVKRGRLIRRRCTSLLAAGFLVALVAITGCTPSAEISQTAMSENASNLSVVTTTTLYDESMVVSLYEQAIPSVVKVEAVIEKETETMVVSLYEQAIPSVVKVEAVIEKETETIDPFQFGPFQQKGQGSGFIIDKEGHILTNNHVVDGASSVEVAIHGGDVLEARIIGTDRENDVALLKVAPDKLGDVTPLPLGDSDIIKPGQMAIALGSPFGLEGSITVGVISAVGRSILSAAQRLITDMLQTDAAINPGNSGGPLLNSRGEVIGINTAIEASSNGIGFAIPINTAKSLLPALLEGGEVGSPWLGIKGVAIDRELASRLEIPVDSGVYVVEVIPDSPAEKEGLRGSGTNEQGQPTFGGDTITDVDGQKVTSIEDLISYFNSKKPDDEVSLSIYRGDKTLTIKVTLGEWPEQITSSEKSLLPKEFDWRPFHWHWEIP